MEASLQNETDPTEFFNRRFADSLELSLLNRQRIKVVKAYQVETYLEVREDVVQRMVRAPEPQNEPDMDTRTPAHAPPFWTSAHDALKHGVPHAVFHVMWTCMTMVGLFGLNLVLNSCQSIAG
jgi:hypothetical protein